MSRLFPHLFTPFQVKKTEFRNRIFSTGHDTYLPENYLPSEALTAYHVARAKGGAGLIVVQVVGVHESARYTDDLLMGTDDTCIKPFARMIEAIHKEGTKVFVQLFHPGRELLGRPEGVAQAAFAPSFSPSERFRTAPRAMSLAMVEEIIEGYGQVARRMAQAGADGVEIVGSHGYLPAQFLNPRVNRREDRFGGSLENRVRFIREAAQAARQEVPDEFIIGLRMSGDEIDADGLHEDETLAASRLLKDELDYFNVIAGTSASQGGAVHIVPPMLIENAYVAPYARKLKQALGKPVFVAGRINQPHEAEKVVAEGAADMCGMTRAMICDPAMANKAKQGATDDIRACIACNQACIGHFQLGLSISCIQYPETGRELAYGVKPKAAQAKRVMVVGGGPAGLKAAAVAAERGHQVTLYEKETQLGGQARYAQLLPARAEFGGIITNLTREGERSGVRIVKGKTVTPQFLKEEAPDAVILASGSLPQRPPAEIDDSAHVIHAVDVLKGEKTGSRVVIYDWLADWIGLGLAEKLASEGVDVTLAVNGLSAGIAIQNYTRDAHLARLHRLGVKMLPMMRLYGADATTAYFLHTTAQEPVVLEDVDTIVLACPNAPEDSLTETAGGFEHYLVGDCLSARTAEEAVYEGLKAGMAV
ncbi:FAD-dependent oxidoreductase [Taklimakanibacter lacteus]|uniref:oxidoreductase n=1 Tax=Taklimakanibacter lacteus TaxID=2268456 RepID=UPI000E6666D7